jgi:hypothetical protein
MVLSFHYHSPASKKLQSFHPSFINSPHYKSLLPFILIHLFSFSTASYSLASSDIIFTLLDMSKRNEKTTVNHAANSIKPSTTTLSDLRKDADLWYRTQVLLYDLSSVANDPLSEKRLSSTTHELYISEPYFTNPKL